MSTTANKSTKREEAELTTPSDRRVHRRLVSRVEPAIIGDGRRRGRERGHGEGRDGPRGGVGREGGGAIPGRDRGRRPRVRGAQGVGEADFTGAARHLCREGRPRRRSTAGAHGRAGIGRHPALLQAELVRPEGS